MLSSEPPTTPCFFFLHSLQYSITSAKLVGASALQDV